MLKLAMKSVCLVYDIPIQGLLKTVQKSRVDIFGGASGDLGPVV